MGKRAREEIENDGEGDIELENVINNLKRAMVTGLVDSSQDLIGESPPQNKPFGGSSPGGPPGASPSPRQPRGWAMSAQDAVRGLNPCEGLEGREHTKCLIRSFLYTTILMVSAKAISSTGAWGGATDILSGQCNPDFWQGAGQLLLGVGGANVSPWCQSWQQVISLIYTTPGMYVIISALVGLFINTRLLFSMTGAAVSRFVDEFINLLFLVPVSNAQMANLLNETGNLEQMTEQDFVDAFNSLTSRGNPSQGPSTRSRRGPGIGGGKKKRGRKSKSKSKSKSRSKSRSKSKKRKTSKKSRRKKR